MPRSLKTLANKYSCIAAAIASTAKSTIAALTHDENAFHGVQRELNNDTMLYKTPDDLRISPIKQQFVMSCRVIGLGVETSVIAEIGRRLGKADVKRMTA